MSEEKKKLAWKLGRGKTIGLIIVLAVGIVGATFSYLYISSGNLADIVFTYVTLEASDSRTFLTDLLTYKKFKFTLTYYVLGGPVLVTCKDFTLDVKIEDLNVGSVQIDDFQISGWSNINTETFLLDLSDLSSDDLDYIVSKFYDYGEELMVEIEGSATIDAVVSSKKVTSKVKNYLPLGSPITLVDVYWDKTSATSGEAVSFHVTVRNKHRAYTTYGTLEVIVTEDTYGSFDKDVETYSFSASIHPKQSSDYRGFFTVYKGSIDTRGFYLKVRWEGKQIYEMGDGYPPRLSVS